MSIPQKMKAVQIVEYNKPYCVREVDVPQPQDLEPHQVLVKIAVASFCHTDEMVRMASMDKEFDVKLPCTGSHEGAGTVAAAGPSVDKFKVGQRVLCSILEHVDGNEAKQYPQYCSVKFGTPGITRDGMFTEYVVVDSRTAAHLPEGVSFEVAAPLACAGCTVWRGIKQAGLKPGRWLALVGSGGGLGHIGVRFAKELGYKVIGVDARDEGLEMTKRAGADLVLDARNGGNGLVDALARATGRGGADATVNISEAETAAATACAITRAHGLMVQIAQVFVATGMSKNGMLTR